jgi:hypothetical protein
MADGALLLGVMIGFAPVAGEAERPRRLEAFDRAFGMAPIA